MYPLPMLKFLRIHEILWLVKPGSHASPMVGDSFSVFIRGENLQRILHISNHRQWTSPTSYKFIVFMVSERENMNIIPPPPPPINDAGYATGWLVKKILQIC